MVYQSYKFTFTNTSSWVQDNIITIPFTLKAKYNKILIEKINIGSYLIDSTTPRPIPVLAAIDNLPAHTSNIEAGTLSYTGYPAGAVITKEEINEVQFITDSSGAHFLGRFEINDNFNLKLSLPLNTALILADIIIIKITIGYNV